MVKQIIANGGATIDKNGNFVSLKSGYQVSRKDLGRIAVNELTDQMVADVIAHGLINRGDYCGVWIDDGYAYVDISTRVSTKKQAIALGKERKQISIFDWKNQACIFCL